MAALKTLFVVLGCVMVATLIYTISTDGLPFRKDLLTPWMRATLVDFYINVVPLAAWVCYKERNWVAAAIWLVLLVCLGSITTCLYVTLQLFKLSADESLHDPVYHILFQNQNNRNDSVQKRNSFQLVTAEVFFGALGCLMFGTLVYTILTYGSPFSSDVLTPWMTATLIDFYINVACLSVWVGYKESSWVGAVLWITLFICLGSVVTCAYVVRQLFQLSPYDPLHLVLLRSRQRTGSKYERPLG